MEEVTTQAFGRQARVGDRERPFEAGRSRLGGRLETVSQCWDILMKLGWGAHSYPFKEATGYRQKRHFQAVKDPEGILVALTSES